MIDLVEARRQAAERFLTIGLRYVPDGFEVHYRKSLSGRCWLVSKRISAPRPVTRKALYIFPELCS